MKVYYCLLHTFNIYHRHDELLAFFDKNQLSTVNKIFEKCLQLKIDVNNEFTGDKIAERLQNNFIFDGFMCHMTVLTNRKNLLLGFNDVRKTHPFFPLLDVVSLDTREENIVNQLIRVVMIRSSYSFSSYLYWIIIRV